MQSNDLGDNTPRRRLRATTSKSYRVSSPVGASAYMVSGLDDVIVRPEPDAEPSCKRVTTENIVPGKRATEPPSACSVMLLADLNLPDALHDSRCQSNR